MAFPTPKSKIVADRSANEANPRKDGSKQGRRTTVIAGSFFMGRTSLFFFIYLQANFMRHFPCLFVLSLAFIFTPAAGRAQYAPIADAIPISGEPAFQIDYKFPQPTVLPGGDPSFDVLDHIDGYKVPPDFRPIALPLPGEGIEPLTTLDFKSSEPPEPVYNPPFGPANFLTKVADVRGRSFGTLKLNVSAGGTFTGILRLGKDAYRLRGTLDASGAASQVLSPRRALRVAIAVQVGQGRMAATVTKGRVSLSAQ